MNQQIPGGYVSPDPQEILQWAKFYAYTMGWVLQPIHKTLGYAPDGRLICSCELTGKRWNNCNPEKPGKHPWKGWKQAPMETPEQGFNTFYSVWQDYPHGVNIGIRTGSVSGIWAVDLDMGGSKNGVIDFQTWMQQHGLTWDDIPTLSAATGGGGYHYVFAYPKDVDKISTVAPHAEMGPSVDIKGDGGYILVAPSMHLSGKIYEWRNAISPEAVVAAPDKLIKAVQKKQRTAGVVGVGYTPTLSELKDYADELTRKRSPRSRTIGENMRDALNGDAIAEDGGAHDIYRDIMYVVAKRWPRCDTGEILEHFQDSVTARFINKPDASTDMNNLMDALQTALDKANEEAQGWIGQLCINQEGHPTGDDSNLYLFFQNHEAWKGVFGYDERKNKPVYLRSPPIAEVNGHSLDLSKDKTKITNWFKGRMRMAGRVTREDMNSAILATASNNSFDPLQQQMLALKDAWDGTPRLETVLQRVAGSPDSEWVRTVTPLWFKSMVARILWPGCKVDTMLILEGKQGYKKSTFFSSLMPSQEYFSDSMAKVAHNIESIRLVHSGPAIFELGELTGLRKQEVEEIKAFLSAQEDDLRPLYEPPRKAKRRCVFVGSTNRDDYLRDETGARRFWPVKVGKVIDIGLVLAEREQWMAEAITKVFAAEIWWLDSTHSNELARLEQDARYEEDIWHQRIAFWLDKRPPPGNGANTATGQMQEQMNKEMAGEYVTTLQVAEYAIKIEIKNARTSEGGRINKILRKLGWLPAKTIIDGKQVRAWKRPFSSVSRHQQDTQRHLN